MGNLRSMAGRNPYDRERSDLVGELSTRSDAFRTWWAAHNVRYHQTGTKRLQHPVVGDLELSYEVMELAADSELLLAIFTAEPGSRSAEALNLLASWAATPDQLPDRNPAAEDARRPETVGRTRRGDRDSDPRRNLSAVFFAVRLERGGPWDWSRDLREQDGWDEHAQYMDALVDSGFVVLGGPLAGDREILHAVSAASEEEVRDRLAQDNWHQNGMLTIKSIEAWTILLDGRPG